MVTIKLSFDAHILGNKQIITFEVPYSDGIVATSRFCPAELLNGDIKLIAALNGEKLEDLVKDCKMQLAFANEIKEQSSLQESLIAGLLASVIAHQTHSEKLSMKDFLLHIDAFSHLVYATGVSEEQVKQMYPKILDSVIKTVEAQS